MTPGWQWGSWVQPLGKGIAPKRPGQYCAPATPWQTLEKMPAVCMTLGRSQEQLRSEVKWEVQQRAAARMNSLREVVVMGLPLSQGNQPCQT